MTEDLPLCACGCGLRVTKKGNRFVNGHQNRGKHHTPAQLAADEAKRGAPRSPEACAAISASKLGVPRISLAQIVADKARGERLRDVSTPHTSPAQIAADNAKRGIPHISSAHLVADERQRGGDDLVDHHYIYDESDLSLNTVKMTRKDHTSLHRLLQKLGYIVPHINVKEE